MKRYIKTLLFALPALMLTLVACDNESTSGTPVVEYIRITDPNASDSLLYSASMGQTIALIGHDLDGVVKVTFNDQVAKLNPVYVTANSIIVTVPGTIPGEVTNTMTLNTRGGGETVLDFTVIIPAPRLTSISNEWAAVGSEAILYGNYFYGREDGTIDVTFPGNVPAEVVSFTDSQIRFKVPENATKGSISVVNDNGSVQSSFIYKDNSGIFTDFTNTSWNWWGCAEFYSEEGVDGQYARLSGNGGEWAWPANALQFFYISTDNSTMVTEGEPIDYALRFEFRSNNWNDTPLLMWFDNTQTHNVDGTDPQYHWRPYLKNGVVSNYVTDGWITVTIPLSDFKMNKDESNTSMAIGSINELVNFNMMFFGATAGADDTYINIEFDNMRLVTNF
ncbi:MAG: glycan-binding surface protein [Mangrovibacterium sp.]